MSQFIFAFLSALVKEEIPLSEFGDRPGQTRTGLDLAIFLLRKVQGSRCPSPGWKAWATKAAGTEARPTGFFMVLKEPKLMTGAQR
jgi:hypothetical protein